MVRAMPVLWRPPDESFGKFVRRLLVENDMKDKDLREAAGISKNALSTILNGSPPRWESAEAIMRVLNVKMVQWGAGRPAEGARGHRPPQKGRRAAPPEEARRAGPRYQRRGAAAPR